MKEVQWSPPSKDGPSQNAIEAIKCASRAAQDFDNEYEMKNGEREVSIPLFHDEEVFMSQEPLRINGYFVEYELRSVRIVMDLAQGAFGSEIEEARQRFSERSRDGHYSVKYLQPGLIDTDLGASAASDMILETKILMNMAPHPNICFLYGVNRGGLDTLIEEGRSGFFLIIDRISETLVNRIDAWRQKKAYTSNRMDDLKKTESRFAQRLEVALDIASALVYLHDRDLVFYVRPDKIGFDTRYGRVKLMDFSHARQCGMNELSVSITKSDDIRVLAYTAPEVLCNAAATDGTDVYAFGIMLWEMMSLRRPFDGYDRSLHFEKVVMHDQRLPISSRWSKELCGLLENCWDPHFRPTMKVVHETLETALLFSSLQEEVLERGIKKTHSKLQEEVLERGIQKTRSKLIEEVRERGIKKTRSRRLLQEIPSSPTKNLRSPRKTHSGVKEDFIQRPPQSPLKSSRYDTPPVVEEKFLCGAPHSPGNPSFSHAAVKPSPRERRMARRRSWDFSSASQSPVQSGRSPSSTSPGQQTESAYVNRVHDKRLIYAANMIAAVHLGRDDDNDVSGRTTPTAQDISSSSGSMPVSPRKTPRRGGSNTSRDSNGKVREIPARVNSGESLGSRGSKYSSDAAYTFETDKAIKGESETMPHCKSKTKKGTPNRTSSRNEKDKQHRRLASGEKAERSKSRGTEYRTKTRGTAGRQRPKEDVNGAQMSGAIDPSGCKSPVKRQALLRASSQPKLQRTSSVRRSGENPGDNQFNHFEAHFDENGFDNIRPSVSPTKKMGTIRNFLKGMGGDDRSSVRTMRTTGFIAKFRQKRGQLNSQILENTPSSWEQAFGAPSPSNGAIYRRQSIA